MLIDEIGKMEEYSASFKEAVLAALDGPKNFLATIREHDSDYTAAIKSRRDVTVLRLTVPDRERTYLQVKKLIA